MNTNRPIDPEQLEKDLRAAKVAVRGVGTAVREDGTLEVFTYTKAGEAVDLPDAARAVLDAHVPPTPPQAPEDAALAALAGSPTNAQVAAAMRGYLQARKARGT
jgi:hypothetical protein